MVDKRLRKLRRQEMLEMLFEIEQENETLAEENARMAERLKEQEEKLAGTAFLEEENARLKKQLENWELALSTSGSLAEASVQISGILEAAQKAADFYLESVRAQGQKREEEYLEKLRKTKSICMRYAERVEQICAKSMKRAKVDADDVPKLKKRVEELFEDAEKT